MSVDIRCVNEQIYRVVKHNVRELAKKLNIDDEDIIKKAEDLAIKGLSKYHSDLKSLAGVALYYVAKKDGVKIRQKDVCKIIRISDVKLRYLVKKITGESIKSNKEKEILELLRRRENITAKELAEELKIHVKTVEWYIRRLKSKSLVEVDRKGRIFLKRGVHID